MVDWNDDKGNRLGTYPGTVLRPEKNNGTNGYILQFEDGPFFVPTDELVNFPIQNENSNPDDLMESDEMKIESDLSISRIIVSGSDTSSDSETFSDDVGNSKDSGPVIFDCNIKSENSNELVPPLNDEFFEDFPSREKKEVKKKKGSKLSKHFPSKQKKHISRQRDEQRTLSSFVGSKMSHTPCGPDQFFGTKQECWK